MNRTTRITLGIALAMVGGFAGSAQQTQQPPVPARQGSDDLAIMGARTRELLDGESDGYRLLRMENRRDTTDLRAAPGELQASKDLEDLSEQELAKADDLIRQNMGEARRTFMATTPKTASSHLYKASVLMRYVLANSQRERKGWEKVGWDDQKQQGAIGQVRDEQIQPIRTGLTQTEQPATTKADEQNDSQNGSQTGSLNTATTFDDESRMIGDAKGREDRTVKADSDTSTLRARPPQNMGFSMTEPEKNLDRTIADFDRFTGKVEEGDVKSMDDFTKPYDRTYKALVSLHYDLASRLASRSASDRQVSITMSRGTESESNPQAYADHMREAAEYFKYWSAVTNRNVDLDTRQLIGQIESEPVGENTTGSPRLDRRKALTQFGEKLAALGFDVPAAKKSESTRKETDKKDVDKGTAKDTEAKNDHPAVNPDRVYKY